MNLSRTFLTTIVCGASAGLCVVALAQDEPLPEVDPREDPQPPPTRGAEPFVRPNEPLVRPNESPTKNNDDPRVNPRTPPDRNTDSRDQPNPPPVRDPKQAELGSDRSITEHIRSELLFDQAVNSVKLRVETHNGIVRLSGNVDDLLAKRRAARIARAVRGVRSVVNQIAVSPPQQPDDMAIREDIHTALLANAATESYEVQSSVENGVAKLTGTVDSWQEKQIAARVASGVKGVVEINNEISVKPPAERLDAEIEREIKEAISWDVHIPSERDIDVTSQDGRVKLSGHVASATELHRATNKAWVAGVNSVNNDELIVAPWETQSGRKADPLPKPTDQEITKAVNQAMIYDPRVFSSEIAVETRSGNVTLKGEVGSQSAKRAAAQNARNTVGVQRVINRLQISSSEMEDDQIAQRINQSLKRNPLLDEHQIRVNVNNGVVQLYGSVDSFYEKGKAEDLASETRGAVVIDNNLVVFHDADPFVYDPYVDENSFEEFDWYESQGTSANMADSEIQEQIEDELFWSPFVSEGDIDIVVNEGVVTLTGKVPSQTARDAAEENAMEGGAMDVVNRLTIE